MERLVAKSTSPTPRLEDQAYREILSSLKAFGQSLEESPDSYTSMGEEDLRNLFLAHLKNSVSSLSATGETFNNHGKTDIMVKSANTILFIAECKIWKGRPRFSHLLTNFSVIWHGGRVRRLWFSSWGVRILIMCWRKSLNRWRPIRTMFARIAYNPRGSYSISFILRVEKTMR